MALSKDKKKAIVEELKADFKGAASVVFAAFQGVTAGETTSFRRALKEKGVKYKVVKKSLLSLALAGGPFSGEAPVLAGQISIAFGNDPLAPAREVFLVGRKLEGRVSILGGIFEGRFVGKKEMEEIALIPPKEILLGQFVHIIHSPIRRLAAVLSEVVKIKS